MIQLLIRSICGIAFLSIVNGVASSTIVGVNLLSIGTIGLLGIPGVVLLYATKILI